MSTSEKDDSKPLMTDDGIAKSEDKEKVPDVAAPKEAEPKKERISFDPKQQKPAPTSPAFPITFGIKKEEIAMVSSQHAHLRSARDENIDVEQKEGNAHALPWEQVMLLLETDTVNGLTSAEAAERLKTYGPNKLAESPPEPLWHKIFRQINSILIYILLVAAIIAGGFQQWAEFGLILGVVAVNVVIGLYQEGKAERATAALKAMLSTRATVIRDGDRTEIQAEQVVPGDIVFIESGNKVPADLRMFKLSNLAIQESMLTGESLPVNKKIQRLQLKLALGDRKNMAFSATNCIKGQGQGICVATGDLTEIGKINRSVSEVKEEKTLLIKQIDTFGGWIGMMTVPVAIASFLLAFLSPTENQYNWSYAIIEAVAIAVAIVPEGLPAIITITLSHATALMAANKAIIKALPAVETLGSVNVICSDKTGTLTKNEMTVVAARTATFLYKVDKVGYDPTDGKVSVDGETPGDTRDDALMQMTIAGLLCNDSRLEREVNKQTGTTRVLPVGDPTEVAIVTFGEKLGQVADDVRTSQPRLSVIPFESEHKFMCTFHQAVGDETKAIMNVKGAPDRLVARSANQVGHDGSLVPLDKEFWLSQASELSSKGLRCLALCQASLDNVLINDAAAKGAGFVTDAPEPFLTFIGLVAILDPPRQECVDAIKEAHSAGIVVKMITGDHPGTAAAIGRALGIIDEAHSLVKTGPDLDLLSPEELREVVMHCNVYARASPENKIQIVRALQAEKQICSMTGDGVNDAPALRAADIGVAMGITGTDVSKDAAKIVLTDDNFATIIVAVKQGRTVWDNLKKLLVFNAPTNFAQGGVVFFALALQWQIVPLSAIQILYVNLITAVTLGIMLAVELPEKGIMERPPRPSGEGLIGGFFYWRTFFVATMFIFFVLGSVAWINTLYPATIVTTFRNTTINGIVYQNATNSTINASEASIHAIALNTLVFCQITYAFNCRFITLSSLHPRVLFGNRLAWILAFVMVALQMLITYVPGLNGFFSMQEPDGSPGMTGVNWGICIFFAVVSFLVVEIEKALHPKLEPLIDRLEEYLSRICCRCKPCMVKCACCTTQKPLTEPKGQVPIDLRLKQGGSLRFVPLDQIKDEV